MNKKTVLFICTHNSCRSQMAEGLMNHFLSEKYQAYSAGTKATSVNPYAIKIMAEIGVDISKQHSKTLDEFQGKYFDCVVTVCDNAQAVCPVFIGAKENIYHSFSDPAGTTGTEEEILTIFRLVRDEIKCWIIKNFK